MRPNVNAMAGVLVDMSVALHVIAHRLTRLSEPVVLRIRLEGTVEESPGLLIDVQLPQGQQTRSLAEVVGQLIGLEAANPLIPRFIDEPRTCVVIPLTPVLEENILTVLLVA